MFDPFIIYQQTEIGSSIFSIQDESICFLFQRSSLQKNLFLCSSASKQRFAKVFALNLKIFRIP